MNVNRNIVNVGGEIVMEIQIIQNGAKENHLFQMQKLGKKADTLIITSPFLSDDMSKFLERMPSINKITIYTTLDKFDDTAQKSIVLYEFADECERKNIDLIIKIDEELHGKVYLFYKGFEAKGFIISSGNFTGNGLKKNHEYGVLIDDTTQQKKMADIIMSVPTYDLDKESLTILYNEALEFMKKHPEQKVEHFRAKKLIDKKPSGTQIGNQHFYIKPVGTSKEPFVEPRTLGDDIIGFNNNPKTMNRGDVLICHSVGPSNIVGYYSVCDDEAVYDKTDENDRWPWKLHVECHSGKFSSEWWNYKIKTGDLVEEFLQTQSELHITAAGTDTIGALQWGSDKLQISKEFAIFIIDRLERIQQRD